MVLVHAGEVLMPAPFGCQGCYSKMHQEYQRKPAPRRMLGVRLRFGERAWVVEQLCWRKASGRCQLRDGNKRVFGKVIARVCLGVCLLWGAEPWLLNTSTYIVYV